MASEIRVDKINNLSGVGTVTHTGVDIWNWWSQLLRYNDWYRYTQV